MAVSCCVLIKWLFNIKPCTCIHLTTYMCSFHLPGTLQRGIACWLVKDLGAWPRLETLGWLGTFTGTIMAQITDWWNKAEDTNLAGSESVQGSVEFEWRLEASYKNVSRCIMEQIIHKPNIWLFVTAKFWFEDQYLTCSLGVHLIALNEQGGTEKQTSG